MAMRVAPLHSISLVCGLTSFTAFLDMTSPLRPIAAVGSLSVEGKVGTANQPGLPRSMTYYFIQDGHFIHYGYCMRRHVTPGAIPEQVASQVALAPRAVRTSQVALVSQPVATSEAAHEGAVGIADGITAEPLVPAGGQTGMRTENCRCAAACLRARRW